MIRFMRPLGIVGAISVTLLLLFAFSSLFLDRSKPAASAEARVVLNPTPANSVPPSSEAAPSQANAPARKEEEPNPRLWNPAEEQIHRRLAEELRAVHPGIGTFLASDALDLRFDEVFDNLVRILDESGQARADQRPPLLLAADRVADQLRFPQVNPPAPETRRRMDQLAMHGLSFQWSELGATWVYSHDLLWEVWRDYSTSPWADDAFVQLLARNWDTSFDCKKGADAFRPVIRQGKDFLSAHPRSRYRTEISYLLAQAHETWWSLSRAKVCTAAGQSDCDEYADPDKYQQGAAEARRRAMDYYRQVLQQKSSGDIAADAQRHLGDIRQDVDPVQRRFFCVYD